MMVSSHVILDSGSCVATASRDPTCRLAKHPTGLLDHDSVISTPSEDFIHILDNLQVNLKDIPISFDIDSLFMKVPISNASNLLSQQCDEDNV
jgi:hypothetical protein